MWIPKNKMSRDMTKPTKWVCAQRRLRSAWALATQWAHSEDSDQSGRMPRLIWVFTGCTVTLLVLSCPSSNVLCISNTNWMTMSDFEYRSRGKYIGGQHWIWTHRTTSGRHMVQRGTLLWIPQSKVAERLVYCNNPKFSDRYAWANSADLDQTAPSKQSDQGLHCLPFRLQCSDSLIYGRAKVQILEWLQQIFWVYEYLENLRYMSLRRLRRGNDSNQPAQLQRLARVLKLQLLQVEVLYYKGSEQQRRWSDCANAQADLHLCCSHMA